MLQQKSAERDDARQLVELAQDKRPAQTNSHRSGNTPLPEGREHLLSFRSGIDLIFSKNAQDYKLARRKSKLAAKSTRRRHILLSCLREIVMIRPPAYKVK